MKPRLFENRFHEGLFCIETPEPRFMISPCNKRHCVLCHSSTAAVVLFNKVHIHRFVNQYEAIMNCSAVGYLYFMCLSPRAII